MIIIINFPRCQIYNLKVNWKRLHYTTRGRDAFENC